MTAEQAGRLAGAIVDLVGWYHAHCSPLETPALKKQLAKAIEPIELGPVVFPHVEPK